MLRLLLLQTILTVLIINVNSQLFPGSMGASRLDFAPPSSLSAFPIANKNRKTKHLLVLTRNGASVTAHKSKLTKKYGTLKKYKASNLTDLGANQQIINGINLRLSFNKFLKGISESDIRFVYRNKERTKKSGICFLEGVFENLSRIKEADLENPNSYPPFTKRPVNLKKDVKALKKSDVTNKGKNVFRKLRTQGNTLAVPNEFSDMVKKCPKLKSQKNKFNNTLLKSWYGRRL